jgi:hypothetical protein
MKLRRQLQLLSVCAFGLLVPTVSLAQSITAESIKDFVQNRGAFSSPETSIKAARSFLRDTSTDHPYRVAVAFHLGSLLAIQGKLTESTVAYQLGLFTPSVSEIQKLDLLLNIASLEERQGHSKEALEIYRSAKKLAVSYPEKLPLINGWIDNLERSSTDRATQKNAIIKVIAQISSGETTPEFMSSVQQSLNNAPQYLGELLFDRIIKRYISGKHSSDNLLLLLAFSSYKGFKDGYPSLAPFGSTSQLVQNRLSSEKQNSDVLWLQVAWSQALHDSNRQACLKFTYTCTESLKTLNLDPEQKDAAVALVHEFETIAANSDEKAQTLIKKKLAELNAKTIVKTERPKPASANLGLFVTLFVTAAILSTLFWVALKKRRAVIQ